MKHLTLLLSVWLAFAPSVLAQTANPPSASPLFRSAAPAQLELSADFKKVREAAKADGDSMETPDRSDPKYFSDGMLKDVSKTPATPIKVKVRARGMSNLWEGEADFPKLRIEIDDGEKIQSTLFDGAKKFRINTHVSTNPKSRWTDMSRLKSENSPLREALAYDEARVLELETPAYRRARIHYFDAGTKTDFTRYGLILETDKQIAARTDAKEVARKDFVAKEVSNIDPVYGAKLFLFHALIGNDDIALKVNETNTMETEFYRPIFNTTVFERPDARRFAIVYDMDMAQQVSGFESKIDYRLPEFGLTATADAQLALSIGRLLPRFTAAQLQKAAAEMKAKIPALKNAIKAAKVDPEGQKIALTRLERFFPMLERVLSFQVIGQTGAHFYTDAKKSKDKLQEDVTQLEGVGLLRLGTPVQVIAKEGDLVKIRIIDIRGDLDEGQDAIGYIEAKVPIVKQIPDNLIGQVDGRDMMRP